MRCIAVRVYMLLSYILFITFFFLMIRRPPISTRTDTLFPYTTLFRSQARHGHRVRGGDAGGCGLVRCVACRLRVADPETARAARRVLNRRSRLASLLQLDRKSTRLNSSH